MIEPDPARHALYDELYQAYVAAYEGLHTGGAFAAVARLQRTPTVERP